MNTLQLDEQMLLAANNLPLLAKQLMAGYMQGLHRSPFRGASQEFATFRPYLPGDSIRDIDWKVWGRSDNLFVREYEEETNFRGYLFLDASKSMDFGDGPHHKFTYAKILCATLALIMKNQKDAPGLALLGEPSAESEMGFLAPSTRADHFDQLMFCLQELSADGPSDNLLDAAAKVEVCGNRAVSILFSDGFFPLEQGRRMLEQLRLRNHDTIFFHLLSPQEMEPQFDDDMIMVDSETGRELSVDGVAMRDPYRKKLEEFLASIRRMCLAAETEYQLIVTDEPIEEALRKYLEMREAR